MAYFGLCKFLNNLSVLCFGTNLLGHPLVVPPYCASTQSSLLTHKESQSSKVAERVNIELNWNFTEETPLLKLIQVDHVLDVERILGRRPSLQIQG